MMSFDVGQELATVERIAERAAEEFGQRSRLDWQMDVAATHANGNPLRLRELLEAGRFNFRHDLAGICNHLNRKTGELEDCFVPRFSA